MSSKLPLKLEMYNEIGQLLREMELNSENLFTAEVKDVAKGIYFIQIINDKSSGGYKVIVGD